jgi:DNA polymerase-1
MQTLWQTYKNHVEPLAVALARTSARGVLIDAAARETLITETNQQLAVVEQQLNVVVGRAINWSSPKQVSELLYDTLKLPVVYKRGSNVKTTDEEALLALHKRYPSEPVLRLILDHRKASKLLSSFLSVASSPDGRMRTSYNPSGTDTFRISSSRNPFINSGMNLQNIPVGKRPGSVSLRHLFIADPGMVLLKGDLVQAEAMVVAWLLTRYGDLTLFDRYIAWLNGGPKFDIHRWAAAPIFRRNESDIDDYQRSVGKIANHAGNYMAGPHVLQATALKWGVDGITYDLAKRIIDTRLQQLPGLQRWWSGVERKLQQDRTLTTCLGRRRVFFDRVESCVPNAVAFEPQSVVGDVCNTAFRRLELGGWTTLLQVHDEVVIECKPQQLDAARTAMRQAFDVPLLLNAQLPALTIPVELASGPNWRDCCAEAAQG